MKKELKQKLKQLEKDYDFYYLLESGFVEILNEYGELELYAKIDTSDKDCVSNLLFILENFDFSFTMELDNCEQLKEVVEMVKKEIK
jgi:hypothetical protein